METKQMKCAECGTLMTSTRENYKYVESGLPYVTLEGIEIRSCPKCGEREVVIPKVEQLHRLMAMALINKKARLIPQEIRFLRKYLGWSSGDFAEHMGVTPSTVSKWERVDEPQPMGPIADRLLRMAVAHGQPVEEYPLEQLTEVAEEDAAPARLGLRSSKKGWEMESAA